MSFSVFTTKLLYTGFCLGLGFYAAKKLSNKIDELLFMNSKEYKEFVDVRKPSTIPFN